MTELASSKRETTKPVIYSRDEHNISRKNIDPDALKIMYRLIRNGYKAFLVGGGVRDLLLNKNPKDFDIGTDATPRKIKYLFRNSRIIGRRFKLVHVYFKGRKIIEVSTFRDLSAINEVESESEDLIPAEDVTQAKSSFFSMRDDNVYGDESTDAMRRDLTINGLFYDLSNFSVIDYVGGMHDLRSGLVRIIGDPDLRLQEDPVRLLRVVRHAARNNFKIEEKCWQALLRNKSLILKSAPMRVYEELKKDLTSGHITDILLLLEQSGILSQLIPHIANNSHHLLHDNCVFLKVMQSVDAHINEGGEISSTAVLALITLLARLDQTCDANQGVDGAKLAEQGEEEIAEWMKSLFVALSVPRKERERIEALLDALEILIQADEAKLKRLSLNKRPYFRDLQCVASLLGDMILPAIKEYLLAAPDSRPHSKPQCRRNHHRRKRNRQHAHV